MPRQAAALMGCTPLQHAAHGGERSGSSSIQHRRASSAADRERQARVQSRLASLQPQRPLGEPSCVAAAAGRQRWCSTHTLHTAPEAARVVPLRCAPVAPPKAAPCTHGAALARQKQRSRGRQRRPQGADPRCSRRHRAPVPRQREAPTTVDPDSRLLPRCICVTPLPLALWVVMGPPSCFGAMRLAGKVRRPGRAGSSPARGRGHGCRSSQSRHLAIVARLCCSPGAASDASCAGQSSAAASRASPRAEAVRQHAAAPPGTVLWRIRRRDASAAATRAARASLAVRTHAPRLPLPERRDHRRHSVSASLSLRSAAAAAAAAVRFEHEARQHTGKAGRAPWASKWGGSDSACCARCVRRAAASTAPLGRRTPPPRSLRSTAAPSPHPPALEDACWRAWRDALCCKAGRSCGRRWALPLAVRAAQARCGHFFAVRAGPLHVPPLRAGQPELRRA
jgi:hypothetical protein